MIAQSPPTAKPIDRDALHGALAKSMFGRNVIALETLASTNTLAKRLGLEGAPEGTLVLAEEQTAGKGRMGRQWLSPRYANLLFSVLLRPVLPTERVFALTMILALAGAEAVQTVSGVRPLIKWPNDLFVARRKLGGILTEFSTGAVEVEQVILGMGLNVNWNPHREARDRYRATSLRVESGKTVSREHLLVETLLRLEGYYRMVVSGEVEAVRERWENRSMLLGRDVAVDTGKETIRGKALGIDAIGALVLEDANGEMRHIINGEASLEEIEREGAGDG